MFLRGLPGCIDLGREMANCEWERLSQSSVCNVRVLVCPFVTFEVTFHVIFDVRCQVSGVRCPVSSFRFQVTGVRCHVLGVRCRVSSVNCQLSVVKEKIEKV